MPVAMTHSPSPTGLRQFVGDLLRRPGSRRDLDADVAVADLGSGLVTVGEDQPVHCRFALESVADGLVVHGEATASWRAECARCLEPFTGETTVAVDELFEPHPVEGETYRLEGEEIDLDQVLRDSLVVEFPLAPVPPADETGRCTVCGRLPSELPYQSDEPGRDERWRALDDLVIPPSPPAPGSPPRPDQDS
jgi:uncharacterized protein